MEGLEHRDTVTDFNLPEGTFFVPAKLRVDINCARCVMTTLAQGDLTKDPGILRTAAQHNQVNVGVYASVLQGTQNSARRFDQAGVSLSADRIPCDPPA
jgi:hypothetical protein